MKQKSQTTLLFAVSIVFTQALSNNFCPGLSQFSHLQTLAHWEKSRPIMSIVHGQLCSSFTQTLPYFTLVSPPSFSASSLIVFGSAATK